MHSFLITGGTKDKRGVWIDQKLKNLEVSPFDRVVLTSEEGNIGVSDVRTFTRQLTLTPSHGKLLAGIITDAHRLTTEAQNALLKTIEEPSPKSIIFLETASPDLVLPTISSRCQIILLEGGEQYAKDDLSQCFNIVEQMKKVSVGERIKMIDKIASDREAAKTWVELSIAATHQSLHEHPQSMRESARMLRRLLAAQKQLAANVTPKLVLDNVFLEAGR